MKAKGGEVSGCEDSVGVERKIGCQLGSEKQRQVKSVGVKTAQVWRESKMARETLRGRVVESKIAREMLCFTIETGLGGHEGRRCRTGGCGLCSR